MRKGRREDESRVVEARASARFCQLECPCVSCIDRGSNLHFFFSDQSESSVSAVECREIRGARKERPQNISPGVRSPRQTACKTNKINARGYDEARAKGGAALANPFSKLTTIECTYFKLRLNL